MSIRTLLLLFAFLGAISSCHQASLQQRDPNWFYPDGGVRTHGFEEIRGAKDGTNVTFTVRVDIKGMCSDITQAQREICTTWLMRNSSNESASEGVQAKFRVCSESIKTNCIVWDFSDDGVDFRNVYALNKDGQPLDFDGEELIEPPNSWTSHSKDLKVTGRITVVDGEGRLIDPIEKIEEASN